MLRMAVWVPLKQAVLVGYHGAISVAGTTHLGKRQLSSYCLLLCIFKLWTFNRYYPNCLVFPICLLQFYNHCCLMYFIDPTRCFPSLSHWHHKHVGLSLSQPVFTLPLVANKLFSRYFSSMWAIDVKHAPVSALGRFWHFQFILQISSINSFIC